ncbi:fimbrillin family protein [Bacteroides sp.]|uniref:fimbrillin family protein n=1 Tax=Bacteroides sp. TaxID=29523 RepID=UPI002623BD39|nr:fimbrillin family protein [Bacteroides sp.]MDD3038680.1 fimbrillin family protein [Bacteroides sp.]
MKQINLYFLLLLFEGVLAGCSDNREEQAFESTPVRIGANIGNLNATTPLEPFEENATIGIFMEPETAVMTFHAENRKYYKSEGEQNSGFVPVTPDQTLYYPMDGSTVSFSAYAPHKDEVTEGIVPIDLSVQTSLAPLDLLYADRVSGMSASQPNVSFVFKHMLTKLHFELKQGENVTEDELLHTLVEVRNISTRASFQLATGSLINRSTTESSITARKESGKPIAVAILLPIEDANGIEFTFTLGDETLRYVVPAGQSFMAGAQYNYTVKINGSQALLPLEIECGISDWINKDYEIEI